MKARQDLITGAVFFVLSVCLLFEAGGLPAGAAMLPRATLSMLLLLSVLLMVRGMRSAWAAAGPEERTTFMQAPGRLLVGVLAMAVYIAAIETVGFYLATALFVPATAYALGARNRIALLLAGIGFLLFAYVVFAILFERVMPAGLLFSQLDFAGIGHA